MDIIDNGNIISNGLNKGGLHLNPRGLAKLPINFLSRIKKFVTTWRVTYSFHKVSSFDSQMNFKPYQFRKYWKVRQIYRKPTEWNLLWMNAKNVMLNEIRKKNSDRIIIVHLNVNSTWNKSELLKEVISSKIDVLLTSESKLYVTFPLSQFILEGFIPPYRLDRREHGGGHTFQTDNLWNPSGNIENIFVEINLRSKNWIVSGSYNPNVDLIENRTINLSKNLYFCLSKYENFVVIGHFNAEIANNYLKEFCASHNLKNLIKRPTFFKTLEKPTSIDHIFINHPKRFHSSSVYDTGFTGLSDFHKLTLTL